MILAHAQAGVLKGQIIVLTKNAKCEKTKGSEQAYPAQRFYTFLTQIICGKHRGTHNARANSHMVQLHQKVKTN